MGVARTYGVLDKAAKALHRIDAGIGQRAPTSQGRSTTLDLGGPEAVSQLDVKAIFERVLGCDIAREFVPIEALEAQARSPDPLAATYGALTLAYAKGDVIEGASDVASRHGVTLRSVSRIASAAKA